MSGRSILPKPSPMTTHPDVFKSHSAPSPPLVSATNERAGLEESPLTLVNGCQSVTQCPTPSLPQQVSKTLPSESTDDKVVSVSAQNCADDMFPNSSSELAGQTSKNEPVTKSKEMNLMCMEVLPTIGYSKSLPVCLPAGSPIGPQSKTTNRLVIETSQNNEGVAVLSEDQTPNLVTTTLPSSLVNQQPISVSAETTTRSVPSSNLLPQTLKGLSAMLAGQIATCLQAKPDTPPMRNKIPISQLSSIFSTGQNGSSVVRVPLGVIQGRTCVPPLSGKAQLKKGRDTDNFVSSPKRSRLEV